MARVVKTPCQVKVQLVCEFPEPDLVDDWQPLVRETDFIGFFS